MEAFKLRSNTFCELECVAPLPYFNSTQNSIFIQTSDPKTSIRHSKIKNFPIKVRRFQLSMWFVYTISIYMRHVNLSFYWFSIWNAEWGEKKNFSFLKNSIKMFFYVCCLCGCRKLKGKSNFQFDLGMLKFIVLCLSYYWQGRVFF